MFRKATVPLLTANRSLKDVQWLPTHHSCCKSTLVRSTLPGQNKPQYDTRSSKERERRPLFPYVLSRRLQRLFDEGMQEKALVMLKELPLDSQNTAVWNLVLKELLKSKKYKVAYQQFIDVRLYDIALQSLEVESLSR